MTTPAGPPPSVPTGLSAPSDTASAVGLSWSASSGGATGYTIYRNGTQIGTSTTTTYTDSTVSPASTYQYTVDAYNGAGTHSAQSAPALSVTTPAGAASATVLIPSTGATLSGSTYLDASHRTPPASSSFSSAASTGLTPR